jgi:trk system potassium uptake protein TrkH
VYLIVVLGWLGVATFGCVPFVISGLMGPADAFFESMAGFTTTGASTIGTPEEVVPSLLLWRSISQWAGGIGIVLLFVAVAPLVGFGATQLYSAEAADPVPERMTTRIRDTAKILVLVYVGLTLGGVVALFAAGMGAFDAVNHALTTVSTGGFSTRSESIAAFNSPRSSCSWRPGCFSQGRTLPCTSKRRGVGWGAPSATRSSSFTWL